MNKNFSKAKILLLSLVFSILLPSLSVFADPPIVTWGTHGKGFDNNAELMVYIHLTFMYNPPTLEESRFSDNKATTQVDFSMRGYDINSYVQNKQKTFVNNAGYIDIKRFANMIVEIAKERSDDIVTYVNSDPTQVNSFTTVTKKDGKDLNPQIILDKNNKIKPEDFEIPKDWILYEGVQKPDSFHIRYNNPEKDISEANVDDWKTKGAFVVPNTNQYAIFLDYYAFFSEDVDAYPDKNYKLALHPKYPNIKDSAKEEGEFFTIPKPELEPEPEPEKKPEPPTRIPETGPRSGGGFSFYNNAGDAAKKPQIDPNFVKIIAVDADTLRVLGISNSYLPRKGDIPVLAYALYEREVANGNLTGYKYKNLLATSEVKAENSLGELFKKHKADYIILLTH